MENIHEAYQKVQEKFEIRYTHEILDEFWFILSKEPLHIQYRIINQALNKYPTRKICIHEICPNDKCIEKLHIAPQKIPKRKNIFNSLLKMFWLLKT